MKPPRMSRVFITESAGSLRKILLPAIKAFSSLEAGEEDIVPQGNKPSEDVSDVAKNPNGYDFSISPGRRYNDRDGKEVVTRKITVTRKSDKKVVGEYEIDDKGWVTDLESDMQYNPKTGQFS